MIRVWLMRLSAALVLLATPLTAAAQSQAVNGSIEGTVRDTSGAALPGVTVTITNTETGAQRSVITGSEGEYRAPLLPLGKYDVVATFEAPDDASMTALSLSIAGAGSVRTQTMRAFTKDEMNAVVGKLG